MDFKNSQTLHHWSKSNVVSSIDDKWRKITFKIKLILCITLSQIYHIRCTLYTSNDQDQPVSIVQNQSTNVNYNIGKCNNLVDGDEWDLWDADIKNQMNAPMQEIVNDNDELNYGYRWCSDLIWLKICQIITLFV